MEEPTTGQVHTPISGHEFMQEAATGDAQQEAIADHVQQQKLRVEDMLASITNDLSKAFIAAMEASKDDSAIDIAIQTWAYESITKIKQVTGLTKHSEDAKSQGSESKTDL